MTLLTTSARLAKAKADGHFVLQHFNLANTSDADSLDQRATDLKDGFYQIIQWKDGAEKPSRASITSPTSVQSDSSVPVVMGTDTAFLSNFWKLTRQYGLENSFTIVPVGTNIPQTDPKTAATTYDNDSALNVHRSSSLPLWVVRCDESATIRSSDGNTTTVIDYFRILESGSTKCWKNATEKDDTPIKVVTASTASRPPQSELFELIRSDYKEADTSIASTRSIVTTATSRDVVKEFYFSTGTLSNNQVTSYISVNLSISARNQGWATYQDAGLWSWFEIAILTKDLKLGDKVTDQIKKVDGSPLTWITNYVPLTTTYTDLTGPTFTKDHDLFKNLKSGDVIAVLACAQYPAWKCDARSGKLNFRQLVAQTVNTE